MQITRGLKAATTKAGVTLNKAIQIIESSKRICTSCDKKLSQKYFYDLDFNKSLLIAECKKCKLKRMKLRKGTGFYALPHDNKDLAMDEVLSNADLGSRQGNNVIMLGANRVRENALQINKHVPRLNNFHSVEIKEKVYRSAVANSAHLTMDTKKIQHKLYRGDLVHQVYQSDIKDTSVGLFHFDFCGNLRFSYALALTKMIERYGSDSNVVLLTTKNTIRYGKYLLTNPFKEFSQLIEGYFSVEEENSGVIKYKDGRTVMSLHYFHLHG